LILSQPLPKFNQIDEYVPQLKQPMFWYMSVWVVIHLLRISFYAGTVTTQMAFFGDDGTYGKIAAWTIPLVPLVTFPIVGRMMDRFGLLMTLPMANVFQILFGLLSLIPILRIQPLTFIVYALGRQFFFGTYFALVIQMFGQRHFGKISGSALFIAGLFVVAQIPLVAVIDKSLGGNFALVNVIGTLVFLPLFHFIYYIWQKGSAKA
jgi:MFS transporter, LAT3 family, solute carrier family 43, member 3